VADTQGLTIEDVVAAGRVLFGSGFRADGRGWRQDLKATYRRRALETHPDRACSVGRPEGELAAEFRRVAEAYVVLSGVASGPNPRAAAPRPAQPPRPTPRPSRQPPGPQGRRSPGRRAAGREARAPGAPQPSRQVHVESLPHRRLRFAEYLYYSGRVSWTAFADAVAWQRRQRPPVGRIAVEWGFLDREDVGRILEQRRARGAQAIPFGEFAARMGYLTSFQLLAVLGRQLRLQRRIGEFFVERGLLQPDELDALRARMWIHNARWRE
jgi:hypothetical protein